MDLQNLFEIQAGLDYHIVKEKGLEGQDLLDEKILALQVELGELANELPEVFKLIKMFIMKQSIRKYFIKKTIRKVDKY